MLTPVGSPRCSAIVTGATMLHKVLFFTKGSNIVIDGFRFSGATSTSRNGAGIRVESKNLKVRNSEFISNENGMMITTGSTLRGTVTIFFFNDTATTEIYTLSLHDALPI